MKKILKFSDVSDKFINLVGAKKKESVESSLVKSSACVSSSFFDQL